MIDFVEYVVAELKSKRLSKGDALGLIAQFAQRGTAADATAVHPLLQRNTSDLTRLSFSTRFSGDEFFLRDHRIHGNPVLPGVAYLEMVRAAAARALPQESTTLEIHNVAWAQPVVLPQHRTVELALYPDEAPCPAGEDRLEFELCSGADTLHCQGTVVLRAAALAPPRHDLDALAAPLRGPRLDAAAFYAAIASQGIALGPAQQGVQALRQGDGALLAEIALPECVAGTREDYGLHPSLLDSAVQAGMALTMDAAEGAQPPLPFALETLRIHGPCEPQMIAWVRHAPGSGPRERLVKLDIDLCSRDGEVRVQLLGFSARRLSAAAAKGEGTGLLLAQPHWQAATLPSAGAKRLPPAQHHVLLLDSRVDAQALGRAVGAAGCSALAPARTDLAGRYTDVALACFEHLQALLRNRPQGRLLLQLVMPDDETACVYAGLSGLLATAAQENPQFAGQLLLVDADLDADALAALLQAEAGSDDSLVRYGKGQRQVRRWQEIESRDGIAPTPLRQDGVYLITGGLGGLGRLFAQELLARAPQAQVILSGRAALDALRQQQLAQLAGTAATRLHYRCMDPADAGQVAQTVAAVVAEFGRIDGILHSAGAIADNYILKKTAAELQAVFAPKVAGTANLDAATRELALDFFVLFSSAVAVFGNAGQADYAAANGFMDGFAQWRNAQRDAGARRGLCVALNWPLWRDGGMALDAVNQGLLEQATGMQAMGRDEGLRAFACSLEQGQHQLLVVQGDLARLRQRLLDTPQRSAPDLAAPAAAGASPAGDALPALAADYLRRQFAVVLKLAPQKIDVQAPLERYGIDSILAMDLTSQLESGFGSLPKTLFFEYQTIVELAAYFVREHAARLAALVGAVDQPAAAAVAAPAPALIHTDAAVPRAVRKPRRLSRSTTGSRAVEPIAIVGLSGRYPESPDLEAYWRNLRDGKDCIVEVPAERWDWRDYYSEDRSAEGRHYSKWGGFIAGIDEFDPLFFNIPPVGAELIDPQERLFLQHAWMAIEDAGYTRQRLQQARRPEQAGQVGVYVGVMYGEYQLFGAEASLQGRRLGIPQSYASIANRVSYVLNLHGPSMTLDSMCSSSLSAIHLACQDLKLGRTHLAIAGGVNVTVHPNKYLILSAGQFISGDGHCQSFGVGGDGYIPGEGVGAVVLKRLSDALADGNHIYGVIKGSALNHGGKTNGYSVPNPRAQSAVIDAALKEYGVDARQVSYIEAHGTGTRLGDPIEIAALSQVFRQYTAERGFCAIGSAKSNIGHCESAAGIAGLTKVLLQMKHRQLVPTLHAAVANPHIDFDASPFVLNRELKPWPAPCIDGRERPRIAGISSFGAGGSNAHLLIEEFAAPPAPAVAGPVLLPLSARTARQLQRKAADLAAFLARHEGEPDLAAIAYTLQVGREAMDHRLALVADSAATLRQQLDAFAADATAGERVFHGQVEKDGEGLSLLSQDEDMREAIAKWMARRKLTKLAELWVRGLEIDWRQLHGERTPGLLSLPTYPFAQDRYWVAARRERRSGTAQLHPLLHGNTSDFYQQSYSAQFSGEEFFLADHRIGSDTLQRRRVLPGAAYLEMTRAAVALALPAADAASCIEIHNVAWLQPLAVAAPTDIRLLLQAGEGGRVDFSVTTASESGEVQLHCQGSAAQTAAPRPQTLDLAALRAQMNQGEVTADALYAAFTTLGLHYGTRFRGVTAIHRGDNELLAELNLPAGSDAQGFVLHPALLDSALQSALGLLATTHTPATQPTTDPQASTRISPLPLASQGERSGEGAMLTFASTLRQAPLPFALDTLHVFAPLPTRVFTWVRQSDASSESLSRLDLDLCNEHGEICASLRGLSSRLVDTNADAAPGTGLLLALPHWQNLTDRTRTPHASADHRILLCGFDALALPRLRDALAQATLDRIALDDTDDIALRYRRAALNVFAQVQTILQQQSSSPTQLQLVVADDGDDALLAGLSGLLDTARIENPQLHAQLLLVPREVDAALLARQLQAALSCNDTQLRTDGNGLQALRWQPDAAIEAAVPAFKRGGVYLITGGLGGLGLLFAREIFATADDAVVVLSGRAPLDGARRATLDALAADCAVDACRLAYREIELDDARAVTGAVAAIVAEFGRLDGVLHSAGMTRDRFIIHKTAQDVAAVLAPKVLGTRHLDLATQHLPLDLFVLFSSLSSALGNAGQADYAMANGFMDRYAQRRNQLVAAGLRRGRSLSIHWPLWQDGGMQVDADTRETLQRATGLLPLRTASAMRAFHRSLELAADQVLVLEGEITRLQRSLRERHAAVPAATNAAATQADEGADASTLLHTTQQFLIGEFAELMQMPAHEVDARAALEHYGMDSVLAMKLTNQLERSFGSLSKTLFFEYQNIAALAAYLVKAFPAVLRAKTGVAATTPTTASPPAASLPLVVPRGPLRLPAASAAAHEDDVAIVGLAGRYPQAPDLDTFWRNLAAGRDCITEIPSERWNHAPLFDAARNRPGKTYSKWGGFLDEVDRFDALFFNISPREAELIDPQERLFLETVWQTLEDAGYSKESLSGRRVGVYVGAMWGQYELYGANAPEAGVPSSSFASIANRVSYFFDFHGPSLALDTMCSSSLTALHLACEAVRQGAVEAAIAGGVNVSVHPNKYLSLAQGNFASSDGRCRSFGAGGDGYVPGEGVGAVLLKPLRQAMADGDQIHAVIKASTINHGGKTNGYTVPNPLAQSELVLDALRQARIAPATLGYIETHGTGTSLGDPIEITGLRRAFDEAGQGGTAVARCAIGSVKSGIGHLESAAGIAALTKVLLQLRHGQLVPSLHADVLNPHIDFDSGPFRVQRSLEAWPRPATHPRRAGISSFGAGGANAHLIVEEFVDTRASAAATARPELVLLSARNRAGLKASAQQLLAFVQRTPHRALADIAFTTQVGRSAMAQRLAVVATDLDDLALKLQRWLDAGDTAAAIADVHDGQARDAQSSVVALIQGEAGRSLLQPLLQQRDLAGLARLWVSGVDIGWMPLHAAQPPRRVSLPTYPFARERYWIDAAATAAVPAPLPRQLLFAQRQWQPRAVETTPANVDGPVLLLGAAAAWREPLRQWLPGTPLVQAVFGAAAAPAAAADYCLDPASDAAAFALIEDLAARNALPRVIVQAADTSGEVAAQLDSGIVTLHALCRALIRHKPAHRVRIVSVATPATPVLDALQQAQAGYLRSLAQETPLFGWRQLSVHAADRVPQRLAEELREPQWQDGAVRYTSAGLREIETLQPLTLPAPAVQQAALKQRGVYVISGGLGGLGYRFATYLAQRYAARLVLSGRSAAEAEAQEKLAALQTLGGEAIYVQADVADAAQAQQLLQQGRDRYGRIDGVIHSAGIHRDAFVLNKSRDDLHAVLASKVQGTLNLDQASRDDALDVFVLFSSVAGTLGNAGQSDYAYANAFLDAFALQRQALVERGERSGSSVSMGWPFWQDGGMQIAAADLQRTETRSGLAPLSSEHGLQAFERLLQSATNHAVVLHGDAARIQAAVLARGAAAPARAVATATLATSASEAAAIAPTALREAAEAYLKALLSAEIKLPVERIDAQERFESFGVDSMMIGRINAQLEQDLGELPKTLFYEYASIEELAGYLLQQAQPALRAHCAAQGWVASVPPPVAVAAGPAQPFVAVEDTSPAPVAAAAAVSAPAATHAQPAAPADTRIAIIGVHGQFPQSASLQDYWRNLREGRELISRVPAARWDAQAFFDADPEQAAQGRIYCPWGGFLDDVDAFDASFFGVTPQDARLIDPQERLFLQSVWSAIEDAGYTRDSLRQRHPRSHGADGGAKAQSADVGVFVGVTTNSYAQLTPEEWHRGNPANAGAMPWSIANRVSYFFDFQGPSLPVDTACSSSLAAIHQACESLQRQDCQLAVAGGVNLYLHPAKYQSLCRKRMLAQDGHCRSFGSGDDGFIPGEGVGAVVLKPLTQALADGDHVYAVIAGSACEHSGRSNGYSAPNPKAQARVIAQALERGQVDAQSIGYVEGHGTGTRLGDNLEVTALTLAFRQHTDRQGFCALGSVKANAGHAESAAGIAAVAKVLLQLRHGEIAPTLHADPPNPDIDFAQSPFYLQRSAAPWTAAPGQPRRALVNSFGAGGVNACLVLEEHTNTAPAASSAAQLIVLSAKNVQRLGERAQQLHDWLVAQPAVSLAALAATLQRGRESMEERLAVVVSTTAELIDELAGYFCGAPSARLALGRVDAHQRRKPGKPEQRAQALAQFQRGDFDALALQWVQGQELAWDEFHAAAPLPRLPLPTYPFARERHWLSDAAPAAQPPRRSDSAAASSRLHPLVSHNASTLKETGFASLLSAQDYYGRDHQVNGAAIFPGAGLLELACVAGTVAGEQAVTRIEDIVWIQPLQLGQDERAVRTVLRANGSSADYVIVSFDEEHERIVHAEGRLCFGPRRRHGGSAAVTPIAELQRRALHTRSGEDCYRRLEAYGFRYGPSFRSVQEMHVGADFALSRLVLHESLREEFDQYLLHPALLDGALQTVAGIAAGGEEGTPYLPFAIDALEILKPLPQTCYALVEAAAAGANPDIRQFTIRLLAESGEVLVRLDNFYVRALRGMARVERDRSGTAADA